MTAANTITAGTTGPVRDHPFRAALAALAIGVVSFVIANATPVFQNASWAHSNHATFVVSTLLWLVIPAVMLVSAIGLVIYGALRGGSRKHDH